MTNTLQANFERLLDLREKRKYCEEERNFALTIKDWPRVTVFRNKMKICDEKIASIRLK